jgi:glutamate-1-semialdehyde 2,1-aminomutase
MTGQPGLRSLARSRDLMTATARVVAGGVGSADRALVAPHPIFIARGAGPRMWDVDGNEYVDYLLGYGPLVLGHAHPRLVEALTQQARLGTIYGAGHPLELAAAERLTALVPSMEQVRFGQSGTEAVESAVRLARAATGRSLILKFEGHYHGWSDQIAVSYAPGAEQAGPAERPATVPMSQGQPARTYQDVIVLGWNDLAAVQRVFAEQGGRIAAVLTEPIACNYGVIEPAGGFLPGLRALCDRHGALLIFDEVQTGVRISLGGAQAVLGVTPDITCMGKAVSGGVPASVIGGRRDLMELIADRRVFQSGTYNTNPLCLAAIPVVLDRLAEPGTHAEMERLSRRLRAGIAQLIGPLGGYVQGTSTMFGIGFGPGPLRTMRDGWRNSTEKIMELKRALWSTGVYTKPTPRDIWYVSTEHTEADIDETLERAAEAVRLVRF